MTMQAGVFNSTQGDSLDDILGVRSDTVRAPVSLPETYKPQDFTEPCPKCRGTGRFTSYTGRAMGQCFTCKGAGKRAFKTSRETRQRNTENAADRVARKAAQAIEDFKIVYPEIWAWMDGSDFPFAVSLRQALGKWGALTDNQITAAQNCIAKLNAAKEASKARVENAPTISMDKIEAAFATARANGLKKLKVRFAGLTFSPAKADSSNAGALYVKDGTEYLGKVLNGKFVAVRSCGDERQARVIEVAADPKAAAVAYGKLTGSCSCCGRELTDPDSVAQGIGPVCATKFGW